MKITYGARPPCIVLHIDHREPFIIRDRAVAWHIITEMCEAYQKVFEERKPQEEVKT